jgi:hypothetical protein
MEDMGFDLLISFGFYYLFKKGNISWRGGWMSQERLERVGVGGFYVYVHLEACGHFMIVSITAIGDS